MPGLQDAEGVLDADPGKVDGQARELGVVADNLDTVARMLGQLETAGVWDSPSGDAFADEIGKVPETLRAVALRLRSTAWLLSPYAGRLRTAQEELRRVIRAYDRAESTVSECDDTIATVEPGSSEELRARDERGRAIGTSNRMIERHAEIGREALADESRLAAELHDLSEPLSDPKGYDFWEGTRDLGRSRLFNNPATAVIKPLHLGSALDPVGQVGLKLGYGQGSWEDLGRSSAGFAVDAVLKGAGTYAKRGLPTAQPVAPPRVKTATVPGLPGNPQWVRTNAITRRWGDKIDTGKRWTKDGARWTKETGKAKAVKKVKDETGWTTFDEIARDWAAVGGASRRTKAAVAVKTTASSYKYGKKTITTSQARAEQINDLRDPEAAAAEKRSAQHAKEEARSLGGRPDDLLDGVRPAGDAAPVGRGTGPVP